MSLTRYACAINGHGLQDIDPTIFITDIQETAPKIRTRTTDNALYDGLRVTRSQRQSLAVSVTFCVREYDTARRKAIAEKACAWAEDGWLTINDRPGQRLWVICDRIPVIPSSLKWTDELTIGFTAYALPYWQQQYPATATYTGTNGSTFVSPAGNRDCYLEAEITATGGTVNELVLAVGGRAYAFTGLGLANGQTLSIGYSDDEHLQYMRVGDQSVLSKRTAASDDDLILLAKSQNAVTITANAAVRATIKARGLWK